MLLRCARAIWALIGLTVLAVEAEPVLSVQLEVTGGAVRVDRTATTLDMGGHADGLNAVCPRLTPEVMRAELSDYLDQLLASRAPLVEFLAAPTESGDGERAAEGAAQRAAALAALRRLAQTDSATKALYSMDKPWRQAANEIAQWHGVNEARQPPVMTGSRGVSTVYAALAQDIRLADGPLLPTPDTDPDGIDAAIDGRMKFTVSPPMIEAASRLRPSMNPDEWDQSHGRISRDVLGPFECRLWRRDRMVLELQDYLEMRGITAQAYRTTRDMEDLEKPERPVKVAKQPDPPDSAGIAPERPSYRRKDYGGLVMLSADPVLDSVLVDAAASSQWAGIQRALYLLLPTQDWRRVVADPARYLCMMKAEWKPGDAKVVRLRLKDGPGAELDMARTYLTRRTYAERLQRLDVIGMSASMVFPPAQDRQRKATNLLIAPKPGADGKALEGPGPALAGCDTESGLSSPVPVASESLEDVVEPPQRDAQRKRRNAVSAGVEYQAGKPLRPSLSLSHEGMQGQDTWSAELAEQGKGSAQLAYSRDFFLFESLRRRLQVSADAFSRFTPQRPTPEGGVSDERREGLQARAVVDLWRDRDSTWGQLELGATQSDVALEDGRTPKQRLTVLDIDIFAGGSAQGTPRSQRWEGGALLALGRATTAPDGFAKLQLQAAYNQFLRSFERWDLRARLAGATNDTPRSEWPTFGGEDSVRGYRVEAAAARGTWSLQNEFWTPLSFLAGDNVELARTLRRSAALALFADVGGLSSGTAPDGARFGLGAGLRVTLSEAFVLRLDWARPVGSTRGLGERENRLYLSFTTFRAL